METQFLSFHQHIYIEEEVFFLSFYSSFILFLSVKVTFLKVDVEIWCF